jgi:hypothetical protein
MSDYEQRKRMFEEIKHFNRAEKEELYRILRRCNEEVSENKNGMFFDLMNLQATTIEEIRKWIEFCIQNKATFEIREKEMSSLANEIDVGGEGTQ